MSESDIQDESELHSDSAQVTLEATERRPRAKAAQHKSGSGEGAGAAAPGQDGPVLIPDQCPGQEQGDQAEEREIRPGRGLGGAEQRVPEVPPGPQAGAEVPAGGEGENAAGPAPRRLGDQHQAAAGRAGGAQHGDRAGARHAGPGHLTLGLSKEYIRGDSRANK